MCIGSKRAKRCGCCSGCLAEECGICNFCKDMRKNGGPGRKKKCCIRRKCTTSDQSLPKTPKQAEPCTEPGIHAIPIALYIYFVLISSDPGSIFKFIEEETCQSSW